MEWRKEEKERRKKKEEKMQMAKFPVRFSAIIVGVLVSPSPVPIQSNRFGNPRFFARHRLLFEFSILLSTCFLFQKQAPS